MPHEKIRLPNGQGEAYTNQWYNMKDAEKEIGIPKASILANLLCIDMHIEEFAVEFANNGLTIDTNQPAPDYYKAVVDTATSFIINPK